MLARFNGIQRTRNSRIAGLSAAATLLRGWMVFCLRPVQPPPHVRLLFTTRRRTRPHCPCFSRLPIAAIQRGNWRRGAGTGQEPWFARRAKGMVSPHLGVNCGRDIGMDDHRDHSSLSRETDLPLFARPNAGTPTNRASSGSIPTRRRRWRRRLPELLEAVRAWSAAAAVRRPNTSRCSGRSSMPGTNEGN